MIGHAVSIVIWVGLGVGAVAVTLAGHRGPGFVSPAGTAAHRLLARPAGRAAVLLLWMWFGWHTFAR